MSKMGMNTSASEVRMRHRRQAYYHGKYHREIMMVGIIALALVALIN
ncbi:hypothetical protein [Lacimicrobium alkaliphilum]|nr:hypothetical protein [Lacimicrobium alkaliphilum]